MASALTPKPPGSPDRWVAHYGGSFDPIHDGHLAIARALIDAFGFDRVLFCPCATNREKPGISAEADRVALIETAIAGEPRFALDTGELGRGNTLAAIRRMHAALAAEGSPFRLFLIRGADAIEAMLTWRTLHDLSLLCTLIAVPRAARDLARLLEHEAAAPIAAGALVLPSDGIPDVSSSTVRRRLLAGNATGLPLAPAVLDAARARRMYGLEPHDNAWITLYRPGYSGRAGVQRDEIRNELFGHGTWRTAFQWGDRLITYREALSLYEDAYMAFMQSHPQDLEWLVRTAGEVFDNAESNVLSGTDYCIQTAASTHLQDIALRRCLLRLGQWFRGDHLVEVRGEDSEGYRFNPGQIPFHRPDLIAQPEPSGWWNAGSIESFWQSNKVFQVQERVFGESRPLTVLLGHRSEGGIWVDDATSRQIPSFVYRRETSYDDYARNELASMGARLQDVRPLAIEPVAYDSGVAVLQEVVVPPYLPAPPVYCSVPQVSSARRPKALSALWRRWIRA